MINIRSIDGIPNQMPDGRTGWPKVVEYQDGDGNVRVAPPLDGRPYRLLIHNLPLFERMTRLGRFTSEDHIGKVVLQDGRKAPEG